MKFTGDIFTDALNKKKKRYPGSHSFDQFEINIFDLWGTEYVSIQILEIDSNPGWKVEDYMFQECMHWLHK